MNYLIRLIVRKRKWIFSSLLVLLLAAVAGCRSVGYYKQAFSGQMEMLSNQQPIQGLIDNPSTPSKLKEKFRLILSLRQFAEKKLNLPAGGHYLSYVDLHRSNAVWNIYAAPEFSLTPKSWWFPVVGSVTYRGYFSEAAAEKYAEKMREKGFDVYVGGVDAYSTLGWFKDPVLNTFIEDSERRLAALIFHELTHQRIFISGDTEFNEAFATAVAEEGLRRWLEQKNDSAALGKYQADLKRKKQFVELIQYTRNRLQSIYGNGDLPDTAKREQKKLVFQQLQENHAKLKAGWGGHSTYDEWFADTVNNAKLNTVATYYDLVPAFHQLIRNSNGDLKKFFAEMKHFTKMSKEKRHQALAAIKINDEDQFFAAPDFPTQAANLPK
ncbi:MAG: aminopeptidase [Verrucomicrobiota bacterium]